MVYRRSFGCLLLFFDQLAQRLVALVNLGSKLLDLVRYLCSHTTGSILGIADAAKIGSLTWLKVINLRQLGFSNLMSGYEGFSRTILELVINRYFCC